jgi:hypothetical protein
MMVLQSLGPQFLQQFPEIALELSPLHFRGLIPYRIATWKVTRPKKGQLDREGEEVEDRIYSERGRAD